MFNKTKRERVVSPRVEHQAAFIFETTWPGWSWEGDASDADKKMFRNHVESLEMYEAWRANK